MQAASPARHDPHRTNVVYRRKQGKYTDDPIAGRGKGLGHFQAEVGPNGVPSQNHPCCLRVLLQEQPYSPSLVGHLSIKVVEAAVATCTPMCGVANRDTLQRAPNSLLNAGKVLPVELHYPWVAWQQQQG